MDRRGFVKCAVGCGVAAACVAGGAAAVRPLAEPRPEPGPPVVYAGAHKVGGPAPRGVPLVPLRVNARGELEGRPRLALPEGSALGAGEADVLAWYRYCGHERAPGLRAGYAGDSVLRHFVAPRGGDPPWNAALAGRPVRPEHLDRPGRAAAFSWRSDGATGTDVLTGVVVRLPQGAVRAHDGRRVPPAQALRGADRALVADLVVEDGAGVLVAASTFCTHFCCLPVWWEEEAAKAQSHDAVERVYCSCHDSVYDVREVVAYEFRPEAAA